MNDIQVLAILIIILGAAIGYILWQKKKGVKCIGCSSAGSCDNAQAKSTSLQEITPKKTASDKD